MARVSGQMLSRYARTRAPLKLGIAESEPVEPIELPAGAVALLMDILEAMAAGQGITVIPQNARTDHGSGRRGSECIATLPDQAAGSGEDPASQGWQAPACPDGRCDELQGRH